CASHLGRLPAGLCGATGRRGGPPGGEKSFAAPAPPAPRAPPPPPPRRPPPRAPQHPRQPVTPAFFACSCRPRLLPPVIRFSQSTPTAASRRARSGSGLLDFFQGRSAPRSPRTAV